MTKNLKQGYSITVRHGELKNDKFICPVEIFLKEKIIGTNYGTGDTKQEADDNAIDVGENIVQFIIDNTNKD